MASSKITYATKVQGDTTNGTFTVANANEIKDVTTNHADLLDSLEANKVTAVANKGLSTNDYDAVEKAKVANALATANAATPLLRPDTITYVNAIKSAGGAIDSASVNAVDKFIITGETSGWWQDIKDSGFCGAFIGNNLASSLVHLTSKAGLPTSFINTNFVEADFSQPIGIRLDANTNKSLSAGFNPITQGLSAANLCMASFVPDNTPITFYLIGNNQPSGEAKIILSSGGIGLATRQGDRTGGTEINLASYIGTRLDAYKWGVPTGIELSISETNANLDSDITFFSGSYSGNKVYSTGSLGFYCICKGLSYTKSISLSNAISDLMISIGRLSNTGGLMRFQGDSITAGKGIVLSVNKWAEMASRRLGYRQVNVAQGFKMLVEDNTHSYGLINSYKEAFKTKANVSFYMIGTNDQIGKDTASITVASTTIINDFKTKYDTIIKAAIFAREKVIIASPPYIGTTLSSIAKQTTYTEACAQVASDNGCVFIDMMNALLDTGSPLSYLQGDLLHPNELGNKIFADKAVQAFNGIIYRLPTLDFPSIAAGSYADSTVWMPGSRANMPVVLGQPIAPTVGITYQAFVSANDIVTVRAYNNTASAIDPASQVIRVTVTL